MIVASSSYLFEVREQSKAWTALYIGSVACLRGACIRFDLHESVHVNNLLFSNAAREDTILQWLCYVYTNLLTILEFWRIDHASNRV